MDRNFRVKDGGAAENVLYASIRFSELCSLHWNKVDIIIVYSPT